MSALTVSMILAYAAACPAPVPVPGDMMRATAQVESAFEATAIHDNSSGRSYAPASTGEAVTLARSLLSQGHSLDAGVMQVNDANWARLGLTVQTVFDERKNICAGKQVLAEGYAAERALTRRVACRYNTGKPDCANGYPEKIEAARVRVAQVGGSAPAPAVAPTPVDPTEPPAWDLWGHADWQRRNTERASSAPPEAPTSVTITEANGEDQP